MNQRDWTIMIYMAGDNNLSVDMAYAMEQIKEVAGSNGSKVNLFVYYDGYSESIPTLYCDYSDYNKPRHVRSYMVRDKLYPVEGKHDENAADARSVINFVDWCVNKVGCEEDGKKTRGRKADKYALIFSGHSMGFQDIGMFKDESSDVAMGMREMNDLLQRITMTEDELIAKAQAEDTEIVMNSRDTGVILGQPLDILGFDSCVMSMLEVGYQFKEVAKTMIASEGSVPNAGWTYAKLLGNLAKKSGDVPLEDTVAEFVAGFVRSQDSYTIGGVAVDMAAWDLSKLDGLNTEFYKLTDALLQCFEEKGSTIYRQMERVLLQVHWKCQAYMYEQNVDLGDFCELLKAECVSLMKELQDDNVSLLGEIATFCDSVLGQLRSAVILSGFSGGKYQYSNGISLFFPWSLTAYEVSRENYETLDFVTETQAGNGWNAFLRKYLREVTLRTAPGPTIKDEETAPIGGSYKPAPEGGSLDLSPVILEMKAPSLNLDDHAQKIRYYSYQYKDYEGDSVEAYWDAGPETSAKIAGHEGSKIAGHEGSKIAGHEGSKIAGHEGSKIAGHEGSKIAGHEGSKIAGHEGSKIAGHEGSKIAGHEGSKIAGHEGSKIAGNEGSKIAGHEGSKIAGHEGSKIAGHEGSKIAGHEGSKIAGHEGSKIAGHEGSKIAGHEGSKIAGHEGSKLAGGGSSSFFDSFKHFKNIESPWNISGFTKDPNELLEDTNEDNSLGDSVSA